MQKAGYAEQSKNKGLIRMKIVLYDHKKMETEVVNLWNECCTFDPVTPQKFRKQALFDENFDNQLCYVAVEEEQVVGFVLGIKRKFPYLERGLEPDRGWISVIFVKEGYRRKGIGSGLLKTVEDLLIQRGVKRITLALYSPNYFFAGLDPENYPQSIHFFEKHSYQAYEKHYSMGRNLHGFQLSDKVKEKKKLVESKGYVFEPFTYEYSLELLEFLKEEFGGGWKRNALTNLQKGKAEERIFLIRNPQGNICACANRAMDDNEMRFGPIGVCEAERNHGLGSILLECAMYEMAKKGIYRMYFMTTDDSGKRYYERSGLQVIRTFVSYHKEVNELNQQC